MKNTLLYLAIVMVLFFVAVGCTKQLYNQGTVSAQEVKNKKADDVTDHYPAPWVSTFRPRLRQILAENNINACEKPQHRINSSGRSYLVKCESGLYYIAWLGQGIVGGPYQMRKGSFIKARK